MLTKMLPQHAMKIRLRHVPLQRFLIFCLRSISCTSSLSAFFGRFRQRHQFMESLV